MEITTEKGISLVIFFFITMFAGSLPIFLFSHCQRKMSSTKGQTILSLLNCFAGGVFLATCVLNLLVEGAEEYEKYREAASVGSRYPFFHLGIGVGFFVVALVERLAMLMSRDSSKDLGQVVADREGMKLERIERHNPLAMAYTSESTNKGNTSQKPVSQIPAVSMPEFANSGPELHSVFMVTDSDSDGIFSKGNDFGDPQRRSSMNEDTSRVTGHSGIIAVAILLALSFHTVFDGLAVGLQETKAEVWTTTAAISVHKILVAASLGLELATTTSARKPWKAYIQLFLFALMAPIGVAIGMGVTSDHVDPLAHLLAGSILQAVATGSFLYVTFFELLGEQLGHHSSVRKVALTACGFAAMALAKIWDGD
ncbi:hypothetical protein ACOMHN_027346 [Nucella lapillus]